MVATSLAKVSAPACARFAFGPVTAMTGTWFSDPELHVIPSLSKDSFSRRVAQRFA